MESQGRRKRTKHDRSYWEEQIKLWQDSQLTQNQCCREKKIPVTTFADWKRKIQGKGEEVPFVEIRGYSPSRDGYIEIEIKPLLTLKIRESIEPELLKNILIAIRGMRCS